MTVHAHGTPITPRARLLELAGCHFCVSFAAPEQGELLTEIEMMINRLIEADQIEGFEAVARRERKPPAEVKVLFTGPESLPKVT